MIIPYFTDQNVSTDWFLLFLVTQNISKKAQKNFQQMTDDFSIQ